MLPASVLSPEELTALLRRRLSALEDATAVRRRALEGYAGQVPRLYLLEGEFELAIRDAEASWVRSVLGELESGAFPGLEMWRANLAELFARNTTGHEQEGERS